MKKTALIICLLLFSINVLAARSVQSFAASYRLLFNGEHVGDATFSLTLGADNHYNFEAFTQPAGKMAADNTQHEVLEASMGRLQDEIPVPEHYYTAVKTSDSATMLEFFYDWQAMIVTRKGDNGQQKTELKAQSQDRLSYLLSAMKLAEKNKNSINVPLLTSTDTKQLSIRKKSRRHIDTAVGRVLAQELEIRFGKDTPERSLWLSLDQNYMPVLLEQKTDKGMVRMELKRIL